MNKKNLKNKILLAEPVIEEKETISLMKRVLTSNFPNEGKFTKLLRHPILTFGMYYLRFRVGLLYLFRNLKNVH